MTVWPMILHVTFTVLLIGQIVYRPDAATSDTGLPCSCAMKPMTEKMTNPENMLVPELTQLIINASLKWKHAWCHIKWPKFFTCFIAYWYYINNWTIDTRIHLLTCKHHYGICYSSPVPLGHLMLNHKRRKSVLLLLSIPIIVILL